MQKWFVEEGVRAVEGLEFRWCRMDLQARKGGRDRKEKPPKTNASGREKKKKKWV